MPVLVPPLPLVYFGRLPLPVSLLVSPSRSFVSFFSGRLLRLRGPLSHPLHRFAAAAAVAVAVAVATPGYGPLLYHRCVARLFSSTPSWYGRARMHARTHATHVDRYAEEDVVVSSLSGIHTGSSIATRRRRRRRSHYARSRALPPRFLFLSSLLEVSLPRGWPSSSPCPSIALPFTPRSGPGMTLAHGNAAPPVSVVDRRR